MSATTPRAPMPAQSPLQAIQAELHAAMNGIAAGAIRQSGMDYRLVYGVELPRLREIASGFQPDRRLAQALWDQNVRETRILATMLYPTHEFDADLAEIWVDSITLRQSELAGLLAMNLLCLLPNAADLAFHWIADERPMRQLCGFLTITRLLMHEACLSPDAEAELRDQAQAAMADDYAPLRRAANNALARLQPPT